MSRRVFGVAGAALATVAVGLLVYGGSASAKTPDIVRVSAKTSAKVSYDDGGGKFSGRIRFTKIRPAVGKGKVPKSMKKAAKSTCYKLYAGGDRGGLEPWVKVNQAPNPGLTLNLYADTQFKKSGRWVTGGLHPNNSHEPFKGGKVTVYGGFYDPGHNFRRNFVSKKFKYKGKKRTAMCEEFTGSFRP